jgi:hypothetical protein
VLKNYDNQGVNKKNGVENDVENDDIDLVSTILDEIKQKTSQNNDIKTKTQNTKNTKESNIDLISSLMTELSDSTHNINSEYKEIEKFFVSN